MLFVGLALTLAVMKTQARAGERPEGVGVCERLLPDCIVLFVGSCVINRQSIHASTSTPRRFQHGTMLFLWRKSRSPHRIGRRNTLQTQNATALNCRRVVCRKPTHPHEEYTTKIDMLIKRMFSRKHKKGKKRKRGIKRVPVEAVGTMGVLVLLVLVGRRRLPKAGLLSTSRLSQERLWLKTRPQAVMFQRFRISQHQILY